LSRPFPSRSSFSSNQGTRINGKIRAREVRVVGEDGHQLGVLSLGDAINLARSKGVDLVEVAPNATPPVCRLIDYGKYKYEQNKRDRESKKHQHANKVKEIQLSPQIDPHDFGVKLSHAIDFLCEEMKVKVVLKFRGREMAHKEYGFQQVEKFTQEVAPFGHPDNEAKLVGRGITVMFSPLPRNKRAKNPRAMDGGHVLGERNQSQSASVNAHVTLEAAPVSLKQTSGIAAKAPPSAFSNNPFTQLDLNTRQDESKSQAGDS
jgi:translation initiation factor IF-3